MKLYNKLYDKELNSYYEDAFSILCNLGMLPSSLGLKYIIIIVLTEKKNPSNIFLISDYYPAIAKRFKKSPISIKRAIENSVNTLMDFKSNFQSTFNINFNYSLITPKNIIELLISKLD